MEQATVINKEMIEQVIETISSLHVCDDEPTSWVDEYPEQAAALIETMKLVHDTTETALVKYLKRNNLSHVEFDLPEGERMLFGYKIAGEPGLHQIA